jgi:outer membrane protein OmpA-like peptidoglycan-associated protein
MLKTRALIGVFFLLAAGTIACDCIGSSVTPYGLSSLKHTEYGDEALSGECTRAGSSAYDECAEPVQPPAEQAMVNLSREERTLYSDFNQTNLSTNSKRKLDALADLLSAEQNITGVRIIGYADRMGDPMLNEKLSKERAENVQRYLVSRGVTRASIADTRWLGARLPTTDCPNSLSHAQLVDCLKQDRRVEIEIDYKTEAQASR